MEHHQRSCTFTLPFESRSKKSQINPGKILILLGLQKSDLTAFAQDIDIKPLVVKILITGRLGTAAS